MPNGLHILVAEKSSFSEKGLRALNDGILTAAATFFEEYRDASKHAEPSFAEATALLVQTYLRDGDVERAAQALEYHGKHSKDLAHPYYVARLTYWRAAVLLAQRKWGEAAAMVAPVVDSTAAAEYSMLALELLGDAYVHLQNWQEAETALTRLLLTNPTQENVLLHNNAGAIFQEHVGSGLADTGWSRSPVVGDLNRDGFVDLVVTNVAGPAHVFLNGCDGRPWLTVILVDHLPNRDAIGAEIAVEGGGVSQVRHIHAGSDGLYGSSAPEAYFGFPPSAMTTSVRVRWPDGTSSSFADVTLRRIATITRK